MPTEVTGVLLQYGLAGVMIIGLSWAWLIERKEHREDNTLKDAKIEALQNARLEEALDMSGRVVDAQTKLKEMADLFFSKVKSGKE